METQTNATATKATFEVSGVSRSGRVRKKSSKLLDFQSPDNNDGKKTKRALKPPRYHGRGRPSNAAKAQRALAVGLDDLSNDFDLNAGGGSATDTSFMDMDVDNGVDDVDDDLHDHHNSTHSDHLLITADSDDELDNLVADLVEGVEAESLVTDGNGSNDTRVRQSLYMIEKSNKRKMLKDGKVITGKLERKDKGKSRYTAYSMWARELRKSGKLGKNQDLEISNTARRLGELWANVSNKDKNAWRRKAKKLSSKERQRDNSSGSASTIKKRSSPPFAFNNNNNNSSNTNNNNNNNNNNSNSIIGKNTNATTHTNANANSIMNSSNINMLGRATTSRTRKLTSVRPQQQQKPVTPRKTQLQLASSKSPTRRKRNYTQRSPTINAINATNGNHILNSKSLNNNNNNNNNNINIISNINSNISHSKRIEPTKPTTTLTAITAGGTTKTKTTTTVSSSIQTHRTQNILTSHKTRATQNVAVAVAAAAAAAATQNIAPVDAAAHLKLLGESLSIIGERLKEHDGQIALSGSLSVLLDSLICSLGPLMCLTTYIPGLEKNQQLKTNLEATLDNIAYVMPGL